LLALGATISPVLAQEPGDQQIEASLADQLAEFHRLRHDQASPESSIERLHAIGRLGTNEAVDALLELLPQLSGGQQMAAVHAISLAESDYASGQLRLLTKNRRSDAVRRQACRDLLLIGGPQFSFLRDHRLAREKNMMIRGEVLRGLIDQEVSKLDDEVLRAAKSKDPIYASAGIFGIGKLRLMRGRKYVEATAVGEDIQLRRDAFRALGELGGVLSFELLMKAHGAPRNLMFRDEIASALLHAQRPNEVKVIISLGLTSSDSELVRAATKVVGLAAAGLPRLCNEPLFELLDHPDRQVASLALQGLVQAESPEIVDALALRLSSDDPQTCSDSLWALTKLNALPSSSENLIVLLATHTDTAVRVQAAAALSCFPTSDTAWHSINKLLGDDSWSVRSTAVESATGFRRTESVKALVALIERETGRVRDDAVRALNTLTGEDFGPQFDSWSMWLEDLPSDYRLPSPEEAAARLKARNASRNDSHSLVKGTYHGLKIPPGGVVFALDISESMNDSFNDKQSFYDHYSNVLSATLGKLPPESDFSVVLFSSVENLLHTGLRPATSENIRAARDFLTNAQPGGGTNLHGALLASLGFEGAQTIFLLTDGTPTSGRITNPDAILLEVEMLNRNRRVRIHTIAAGSAGADFLAELAIANGGEAVDLTGDQQ